MICNLESILRPEHGDCFRVLDWIVSRRVHEFLDVGGRPVGEGRSAAFRQVRTEMRPCPYAGSRYHHANPMNATALQQLPPGSEIQTMLSWMSQRYRRSHATEIKTSNDLAQVTSSGVWLADFLTLRRQEPLGSSAIPVLISGLYKVCLGFQLAYLGDRFSDESPTELPDAAGFLAYLENERLLIGESEVCSGSPAMITQAYAAITAASQIAEETLSPGCASLAIDWPRFDVFKEHADWVWKELVICAAAMPALVPRLADSRLPHDLQARLNTLLESRGAEILEGQSGLVIEIARLAQSEPRPRKAQPRDLPETAVPEPGSLAEVVFCWLSNIAPGDTRNHPTLIAEALHAALAPYEAYEGAVLERLNQHMNAILNALGFAPGEPLTPVALSQLFGATYRDWSAQ